MSISVCRKATGTVWVTSPAVERWDERAKNPLEEGKKNQAAGGKRNRGGELFVSINFSP